MKYIGIVLLLIVLGCNNTPTLQKYFVENMESKDFISIDLGSDIINTDKVELTNSDKEALNSFKKINVLAFRKDSINASKYAVEMDKVKTILNDSTSYSALMKLGSGKDGASIYFIDQDDHINEFVLFANSKDNGFAVVRVLGENMDPSNIIKILNLIKKSNIDLDQLKPLQELMK